MNKDNLEVIVTHENADFDAVASLLGASRLFPGALPMLPHRVNRNCADFVALFGSELPLVDVNERPRRKIIRAILVDTQGLNMVRGMTKDLRVDIIDHHILNRELPPRWSYTGEQLGATTTLLIEAISARSLELSSIEATLLLLGIYEDTGSLSYENTTSRDMRAAAWLMERG
ncbi:MAG: DHH family phosphoesterase, partial [Anaerolineae bacterium]|nr:DHH family phosphoesterase [Anaerolineae bacterium]